jgi:hypothetical protein
VWQYRAAGPYACSDMTGFVTLGSTSSSGSWTFVHDEGTLNRVWNKIAWNGTTPYGTGIRVEVRASSILTELPNLPFVAPIGRDRGCLGQQLLRPSQSAS